MGPTSQNSVPLTMLSPHSPQPERSHAQDSCVEQSYDGGVLGCLNDCTDWDVTGCYVCGDNTLNGMEECDGADLGGATCASLAGFDGDKTGLGLSCDGATCLSKRTATSSASGGAGQPAASLVALPPRAAASACSKAWRTNLGLEPRWKTRWSCESTHATSPAEASAACSEKRCCVH